MLASRPAASPRMSRAMTPITDSLSGDHLRYAASVMLDGLLWEKFLPEALSRLSAITSCLHPSIYEIAESSEPLSAPASIAIAATWVRSNTSRLRLFPSRV